MNNPDKIYEYAMERQDVLCELYERDKLEWMISHGKTLGDLIRELQSMLYDRGETVDLMEVAEEWECEVGFGGEIYPCFDEWRDSLM